MDWNLFGTVFGTILIAELGDKTQLATLLYASSPGSTKWAVFLGASIALVLTTAIGVLAGSLVSSYVSERALRWIAGVGFIAIGLYTIARS